MQVGAFTQYIDVAQVALYVFWLFFVLLVLYLNRESRREGFPLRHDPRDRGAPSSEHKVPAVKTYTLLDGETVQIPNGRTDDHRTIAARALGNWPGAPLVPTGNPMLDGVGPASWAERADKPDTMASTGEPRIVPMSQLHEEEAYVSARSTDPRGLQVRACDGVVVGTVTDILLDRMEFLTRYFQVTLHSGRNVLLPMMYMTLKTRQNAPATGTLAERMESARGKEVRVASLNSAQFEHVPVTASASVVTMLEEEKIQAYYGGAHLYGSPQRTESFI